MACVFIFSLNILSYFVTEVKARAFAKVKGWCETGLGPCFMTMVQVQPIKNKSWSVTEKETGPQMGKTPQPCPELIGEFCSRLPSHNLFFSLLSFIFPFTKEPSDMLTASHKAVKGMK